jgi:hypothetical protein
MPAYVVITKTRTRNQAELALYAKQAPTFMAGHAATFVARFGACETVEGAAVEGVAIIDAPLGVWGHRFGWFPVVDHLPCGSDRRLAASASRRPDVFRYRRMPRRPMMVR